MNLLLKWKRCYKTKLLIVTSKKVLINSQTRHVLCLQDGLKTITLQPIFKKKCIAVMESFRRPTNCQKHKSDNPFKIIISSNEFPLYFLAFYLHEITSNNIPNSFNHIDDNSFQLVKKLNESTLGEDFVLVSLNVISLFTNIPIDLAIESISIRWTHISSGCNILKNEFYLQLII